MVPFPNIMLSKGVEQIGYTHILDRSKHTVALLEAEEALENQLEVR